MWSTNMYGSLLARFVHQENFTDELNFYELWSLNHAVVRKSKKVRYCINEVAHTDIAYEVCQTHLGYRCAHKWENNLHKHHNNVHDFNSSKTGESSV